MIYLTIKKYLSHRLDLEKKKGKMCHCTRSEVLVQAIAHAVACVHARTHTNNKGTHSLYLEDTKSGEQREAEREEDGKGPATESRIVGDRTE